MTVRGSRIRVSQDVAARLCLRARVADVPVADVVLAAMLLWTGSLDVDAAERAFSARSIARTCAIPVPESRPVLDGLRVAGPAARDGERSTLTIASFVRLQRIVDMAQALSLAGPRSMRRRPRRRR